MDNIDKNNKINDLKVLGLPINLSDIKRVSDSYASNIRSVVQSAINQQNLNSYNSIQRQLNESVFSLNRELSQCYVTTNYMSDLVENMFLEVSRSLTKQMSSLFDVYKQYFKKFENIYDIAENEAIKILKECEWPITPSIPKYVIYDVVIAFMDAEDLKKGKKDINILFYNHFSADNFRNLELLVTRWESEKLFRPKRLKIIKDCLSILKTSNPGTNPSNLIVPTLIAQIDGIKTEFMKVNGFYFEKNNLKDPNGNRIIWKNWYKEQTSEQDLLNLANDIFLDVLWERAYNGDSINASIIFNRHKIMHGEYTNYGSKYNTIRAFLILDFLAILIEENQNLYT